MGNPSNRDVKFSCQGDEVTLEFEDRSKLSALIVSQRDETPKIRVEVDCVELPSIAFQMLGAVT